VLTRDDRAVAAGHSVDPARWLGLFDELLGRVAGRFGRVEPRRRARAFMLGLLADLPRKNCWTIAEHAGDATPDGMQHLLARARWDADGVRDDLRGYVAGQLGDPNAVLVVDETGDLKKGTATAGVQRQYTGTAGAGAKGHRYYDWAWLAIDPGRPGHRWLLIRRNRRTRELAFYRCYSPRHVPLAALVKAAGSRWAIEESIQASKGLAGLDEHQVRTWASWHRWVTLALLAAAFLTIAAGTEQARSPAPAGQIPLTRNEIARLFAALIIQPAHGTRHRLRWSAWRRHHQHRARTCHYQRQTRKP
jgi:SRSO17 transposase